MSDFVNVKCLDGNFRGQTVKNEFQNGGVFVSFQGIQYAKPPTGDLRFQAPRPLWEQPGLEAGITDALHVGPVAPSRCMWKHEYIQESSEDCLFLNVYVPGRMRNRTQLAPVMFWIHGGCFVTGSGNPDEYGPEYLVETGVVLVTCNYRLGVLGFLSLETKEYPGNYGLKDVIMALRWVQRNIKGFGGDPSNVTIFGQSAGGAAVEYLMMAPGTEDLFHKAIAQSGSALNPWAFAPTPRECAYTLGRLLGCLATDDKQLIEYLRTVSAKELVEKGRLVFKTLKPEMKYEDFAFVPCAEPEGSTGVVVLDSPRTLLRAGSFKDIPFMAGITNAEGIMYMNVGTPVTDTNIKALLPPYLQENPNIVEKIKNYYFSNGFSVEKLISMLSTLYISKGVNTVVNVLRTNRSRRSPVFYYQFSFDGDGGYYKRLVPGLNKYPGVCHCDELGYLFKVHIHQHTVEPKSSEESMIQIMCKMWSNFAKNGQPMEPLWQPATSNDFSYLDINEKFDLKMNLDQDEMDFWSNFDF